MYDVTIITPTYNSENTIKETIKSVKSQIGVSIQHIIVDGKSSDTTIDLVKKYQSEKNNIFVNIICEKDKGVYDAMNKGVKIAEGKLISILNSDDIFNYKYLLSEIFELYKNGFDIIYGDLIIKDYKMSKILRTWIVGEYYINGFKFGWHPAHPSFFVSKKVYDTIGLFNLKYKIASDFDFMLRSFNSNKFKSFYLKKITTVMRIGGVSTGNLFNIYQGNMEILDSLNSYGYNQKFIYLIRRFFKKVKQYF